MTLTTPYATFLSYLSYKDFLDSKQAVLSPKIQFLLGILLNDKMKPR